MEVTIVVSSFKFLAICLRLLCRNAGEVGEHQDGTFIYTNPQSVIGFWWALDDCTMSNGCLWAVPESHKLGVSRRFRRKDSSQTGTEFVPEEPVVWDTSSAVPLEVSRGSLTIFRIFGKTST